MNVSNPQIGQVHIHQDMRYFNISSPNIGVMTRLRHRRELRGNDDQSLQDASKREHVMEMFSREELQRLVQEKDINIAAFNLSDESRIERLGRKLSLASADVDRIKEDYRNRGFKEVVFQMLLSWKRKDTNVTIEDLVKVLCDSKMEECAIAIKSSS
ncbi:uncharacterized protein LOC112556445 isoform X2 [Pomacea canaliculata]|nr:uncharacterized protein LOC112556445 isoform X2 [Pomacea canaliculata]XP_025081250.1 uncharacterized protein LOC112556445 isoform X2 [Pomacea canaliculata]